MNHSHLHRQALRYSYFYVGQALGTPQQILEQGRPQPALVQPQSQPTLHQPHLLLKPVPPNQPPPPNQHTSNPLRPLQQIQPPLSASVQAAAYQRHTELAREQLPNNALKLKEAERVPQSHLPYIVDKGLQSKVSCSPTLAFSFFFQKATVMMDGELSVLFSIAVETRPGECQRPMLADQAQGGPAALGPQHRAPEGGQLGRL